MVSMFSRLTIRASVPMRTTDVKVMMLPKMTMLLMLGLESLMVLNDKGWLKKERFESMYLLIYTCIYFLIILVACRCAFIYTVQNSRITRLCLLDNAFLYEYLLSRTSSHRLNILKKTWGWIRAM